MIKINLLGMKPPKVQRRAVPAGAATTLVLLLASLVVAGVVLYASWKQDYDDLVSTQNEVQSLTTQKNNLANIEQEVTRLEQQKTERQNRLAVIDSIKRNRTGGQELLDTLAGTVVRTDQLWLTLLTKKGDTLTIEGMAGSIHAVANFITQLKRSGYFDKVEIKESRQDERNPALSTYVFSLTAEYRPPAAKATAPAPPGRS